MNDATNHDSVRFAFKQTVFGIVLMVQRSIPAESPGMWCWGRWKKATFADLSEYLENTK